MKYSVGQKVKIRSLEWYRDNVNRYGIIECGKYEFFEPMNEYCGKVVTIKRIDDDNYRIDTDKGAFCWTDEMIEGLVEEKIGTALNPIEPKSNANCLTQERVDEMSLDKAGQITDFEYEGLAYTLPDGYQFVGENGNIINATKIVLEKNKKEYPKTYEECCVALEYIPITDDVIGYKWDILQSLQKLLICRDAYWKIAGEEMGIGKLWKPNLIHGLAYTIQNNKNEIGKSYSAYGNKVLMFPTEEMRDAFYEKFEELIEQCKELL